MTMAPPDPVAVPRGTAVPFAGTSPRRWPEALVGAGAANCPAVDPPLEPDVEDDPLDVGAGAGADDTAVPEAGAPPPLECCAEAATGSARTPTRTAKDRARIISTYL